MTATNPSSPRNRYWRSLNELQETEEFQQLLHREFPVAASEFPEGISRRRWIQLMGASLALGGAVGCRYPEEQIAPFAIRPEGRVPGQFYSRATNISLADRVYNLLVTCVDGRPLKVEGNPDHPSSQGGTDPYVQASVLSLYDPDRKGAVIVRDQRRPRQVEWAELDRYARGLVRAAAANGGSRFAVVIPPVQSPSLVRMLAQMREALPQMTLCRHNTLHGDVMRQATEMAIGRPGQQVLELQNARVIVSIQADFLGHDPSMVRNARTFAETRDPESGEMSRLYVVEGVFSNTGISADARVAIRPSQMPALLADLERRVDGLMEEGALAQDDSEQAFDELTAAQRLERFLDVVARELVEHREAAVVVVGEHLGPEAVAAGIRLNGKLGSLGTIQHFSTPADAELDDTVTLAELTQRIRDGDFESIVVLGGNPVYTAPGDVPFGDALGAVENTIYLGEYDDETASRCLWSAPESHPLESWGDCLSDDGHYGVSQPHIRPLLGGRTAIEVLARMLDSEVVDPEQIVRNTADAIGGSSLSDRQWRQLLHDGFAEGLGIEIPEAAYTGTREALTQANPVADDEIDQDNIELLFVPADGIYDGRFANNGWLQEMPQSVTKLTWDNAAVMAPRTAKALNVRHGNFVALRRDGVTLELPVFEIPGCAPGVVAVAVGYGRTRAGAVGGDEREDLDPVGINVQPLRRSDQMLLAFPMEARPRSATTDLATTQDHWAIDTLGRKETQDRSFDLIREGTLELFEQAPGFAEKMGMHFPGHGSLWEEPMQTIQEEMPAIPQWGMSIDLNKCIGCNACVVACQSENNVPIVGKEQVNRGREMHWLRVDRYFQGDEDQAQVVQQPMTCHHCETAPCEQVCPVAATVHTEDGLNAMVYNRCVGTRYCANNCPYKVRRFNYFNYNGDVGEGYGINAFPGNIEGANRRLQQLVLNPEVTVRGRGVMEKCTFCVQRIQGAKIAARREGGRAIADGEVQTACQTACPTRAIEFGNIADPEARVTAHREDPRHYYVLEHLNVKPRLVYLARIRNTHPRLMTRRQIEDLQKYTGGHGHDHHADEIHREDEETAALGGAPKKIS